MGWTTPTTRATGYLVTAANWNTDIVDNLKYLKGSAGALAIEDDIVLATGKELIADKIFAGPYRALHLGSVRELSIEWDHNDFTNYQLQSATGNGGAINEGGSGQIVLKVDLDNGTGSYSWFALETAQNSALATPFNASRNPYLRIEFANHQNSAYSNIFIGWRQTPGNAVPQAAAENFAGVGWHATQWQAENSNGTTKEYTALDALAVNTRHVAEVIIIGGTSVEIYVDGTLVHTGTTYVPSGDLYFSVNNVGKDDVAANNGLVTVGKLLAQENLA